MSPKIEKRILGILVILIGICLLIQYIIGVDNFSDPVMAKYLIETVLYPSGLVVLILIWRQTLDKKIQSKKEREKRFENSRDAE